MSEEEMAAEITKLNSVIIRQAARIRLLTQINEDWAKAFEKVQKKPEAKAS